MARRCVIYHNNGDGTFTAKTREIGLDGCWGTMSGSFGDVNNDGYIDLLLGNGSPRMDRLEPFILLENDGGQFRNTTFCGRAAVYRQEPRRRTARICSAMAGCRLSLPRAVAIRAT